MLPHGARGLARESVQRRDAEAIRPQPVDIAERYLRCGDAAYVKHGRCAGLGRCPCVVGAELFERSRSGHKLANDMVAAIWSRSVMTHPPRQLNRTGSGLC